jgi:hypothetical protein
METRIIALIKWLFFAIGAGLLIGAAKWGTQEALYLAAFGALFALIGGAMIAHGWWSANRADQLRTNGRLIHAELERVELNESFEVNGTHPFRIVARWHDAPNNQLYIFRSANLWFDPSEFIPGNTVPVYIDPNKPTRYHLDTSFLPTVHS